MSEYVGLLQIAEFATFLMGQCKIPSVVHVPGRHARCCGSGVAFQVLKKHRSVSARVSCMFSS